MLTNKLLAVAVAFAALTGCTTTGPVAEPHQHMRDAKQGFMYPAPVEGQAARKPLHDHREMK